MLRLVLAWSHLIALGIGLGAVWSRARALSAPSDESSLSRAFAADTWWGIAAVIWIVTGLWRWTAGMEKVPEYYVRNHAFLTKMALLAVILILEIWPMVTLIRWRAARRKGTLDMASIGGTAQRIAAISYVQTVTVVIMVALAVAMARGYGMASG